MKSYLYLTNPWWQDKKFDIGLTRQIYLDEILQNFPQKLIQIITGLRRVGKSTLVLQLIENLIVEQKIDPKKILFFSVEEPVLMNKSISEIINEFRFLWKLPLSKKIYVFIDEIQFREDWEREIKSLYDSQKIKFVLTGSSALLLSEKTSYLTGRYLKMQVNPLDFTEYLQFKNHKIRLEDQHLLVDLLEKYLIDGGMPENVLNYPNKYLETTVESILFKDIVSKFQLRNPKILLDLMYLLADRIGTNTSSLKLSKILQINKDTTLSYINYLQKVFLILGMSNYSTSRNKQIYNPEKIYFADMGMASTYASKKNTGALAENVIFNYLHKKTLGKRKAQLGYWYESGLEIDFILEMNNMVKVFESKWVDKMDEINFKPLEMLIKSTKVDEVTYITRSLYGKREMYGHKIRFIPLPVFLREKI